MGKTATGKAVRRGRKAAAAARTPTASGPRNARALPETRIGPRLKQARLAKGLLLRDVADAIGCSESFISRIENDKVRPSLAVFHRLVMALEINIAALFAEPGTEGGPGSRAARRQPPDDASGCGLGRQEHQVEGTMPQAEGGALAGRYPSRRAGRKQRRDDTP